jgi:hypothetical protein
MWIKYGFTELQYRLFWDEAFPCKLNSLRYEENIQIKANITVMDWLNTTVAEIHPVTLVA